MQPHVKINETDMRTNLFRLIKSGVRVNDFLQYSKTFIVLLFLSTAMFYSNQTSAQMQGYDNDYYNESNNNNRDNDYDYYDDENRRKSRYRYRNSENDKEYHRAFREEELMNKRRSRANEENTSGFGGIGLGGLDNLLKDDNKNNAGGSTENNLPSGNYGDYSQTLRPDELQSAQRASSGDLSYDKIDGGTTPDGQTPPPPPPPPDLPISNPLMLMILGLAGIILLISRKKYLSTVR
jgi:hypothetical protein